MSLATALKGAVADARPLQNSDFRRLWVTQIITIIGAQPTATDISPRNTANTTRNRSSTGTVRPGFCDLLMTAILPGTQPGDPDRKPDSLDPGHTERMFGAYHRTWHRRGRLSGRNLSVPSVWVLPAAQACG